MSLPARQRRALELIDAGLCRSEPRLASMFAIFTRLCGTELSPWREQLRPEPAVWARLRALTALLAPLHSVHRRGAWSWAVVVGQLTIVLVLTSVLVALNLHPAGRCGASTSASGKAAAAARVRGCPVQIGPQNGLLPK